jgi:hypothetical protein
MKKTIIITQQSLNVLTCRNDFERASHSWRKMPCLPRRLTALGAFDFVFRVS